jgi:hypothetical protein
MCGSGRGGCSPGVRRHPARPSHLGRRSSWSSSPSAHRRARRHPNRCGPCATSNLPQPQPSLDLTLFAGDLTCSPVCLTVDTVLKTVNATLEPPRSEVTLLHLPNRLKTAVGSPIVANFPHSSALLPVRAGLYALQACGVLACVARLPDPATREFHTQATWRRHVRSHVPGSGVQADERLPFMAAAAGGSYCPRVGGSRSLGKARQSRTGQKNSIGCCASQERHVARRRTPR